MAYQEARAVQASLGERSTLHESRAFPDYFYVCTWKGGHITKVYHQPIN